MLIKKSFAVVTMASAVMLSAHAVQAQVQDGRSGGRIANIGVNYTEAEVGEIKLPDVLTTFDGKPVTDAKMWTEVRRPELRKYIEENYYGRIPATAPKVTWEVVSTDENALDGKAVMKKLAGKMGTAADAPAIDVTLYTPKGVKGSPVLTAFGFGGGGGGRRGAAPVDPNAPPRPGSPAWLISNGYGYATIGYSSIETDREGGTNITLARKLALAPGQEAPNPDEWGTIASWAWGLSRLMDYYETDQAVDAKRIAITGTSRLGKTVTWAGANDQRIALVIACCGGEGGAALARRNYGETIAHLVAPTRYPYQFAGNYQNFAADPNTSKVDTHCLVALMAPRPILLSTGVRDGWSDPMGEYHAAVAATPVYKLLGKTGVEGGKYDPVGSMVGGDLSFLMTTGDHGSTDWPLWLKFMDEHLKK